MEGVDGVIISCKVYMEKIPRGFGSHHIEYVM